MNCPAESPIRICLVFAAFPANDLTPYKYFLLLLNRLQRSCEYEIYDISPDDKFINMLASPPIVDADAARNGLADFGVRVRQQIVEGIKVHDLAEQQPDQIIVITGVILSDNHYLIRRGLTTMLALGAWEKHMAPPSLLEFLQLLVLRAPYSALQGNVWNSLHLGNRSCIFDFTENLDNTRLMALTGVGVCANCAIALEKDGFPNAAAEIRQVAAQRWRGVRTTPGSPANIVARLGYDLFFTKGFEPSFHEWLRRSISESWPKELVKFMFAVLLAWLVYRAHWS